MAKAKFPGRPSKIHSRKRVLSSDLINCKDFDGFRAAEDAYCRLSVFNYLFAEENEGSQFHGFSPHDIEDAKKKYAGYLNERDTASSAVVPKVESSRKPKVKKPVDVVAKEKRAVSLTNVSPSDLKKTGGGKPSAPGGPTGNSGKFVLPTRSAHSSRVIKPNKRFLESSTSNAVNKRARLDEDDGNDLEKENSGSSESGGSVSETAYATSGSPSKDKTSPVKFVLHKPKLKISSEPFSPVEGPFSSQSSPPSESLKDPKKPPTKVICGVCGSMWYYKHVKQARKYGIFSCDPCNKFIMKTLKALENKSIGVYACTSAMGNCVIRQSTLGSCIPFSTEKPPENTASPSRCQACWLNLCLHSYHLPPEVVKRLSKCLPPEIKDRPVVESESKKPGLRSSADALKLKEKDEPKEGTKELVSTKASKGKIKLPLAGPRIKHVCRSASLVLGQPVSATFDDKGGLEVDEVEKYLSTGDRDDISSDCTSDVSPVQSQDLSQDVAVEPVRGEYQRPVARTLQDLGKDNCDLLDGLEKYEYEKKFAKVAIDFWESYDPEEVTLSGFPLIGFNHFNVRALCFLCGSAGFDKLVHCSNCCEAYHTFCVSSLKNDADKKEWWRLDWFCPKCTECRSCSKPGGTQLLCASCHASYHTNCVSSGRANVIEGTWMCPSCLNCSSCHDPMVDVFVGNVPLCKQCFKLRKKGNFCPLCQVCYDDNDYDTKMMECAECKKWIHAKCEKINDETYQLLSYLPSSIEFVCRNCCTEPPALWTRAVSAQLKVGLLNVIKALSKNKTLCNKLKASPMKKSCSCKNYLQKPILLKNLSGPAETPMKSESESEPSVDDKCPDLGLLTPNLTKDDEECLQSAKINLVNSKVIREDPAVYEFREDADDLPVTRFEQTNSLNLLSIVGWANDRGVRPKQLKSPVVVDPDGDKRCSCETEAPSPPSIMEVKKKIQSNHYSTLKEFNKDMLEVLEGIHHDSTVVYKNSLNQIFPWFDSEKPGESSFTDNSEETTPAEVASPSAKQSHPGENALSPTETVCTWQELLCHEPDYYYINNCSTDLRTCMFCKMQGEGQPSKEGRLLYCGHNEWVHLNCAMWSSEVFEEIDGSLQNVHSAISRARMIRCFTCGKKGASVGCCARSCPSAYHLACAMDSNCVFLANKEVYCKNHVHMRGNVDLHDPKDFLVSRSIYVELDPKKRKEVLFSDVRMAIGSMFVQMVGEVVPEESDFTDVIVPCNYECSRWFWSTKEPWKLVRYAIATRMVSPAKHFPVENDINYTINHALEFTPPPSPVHSGGMKSLNDEKDVKNLLSHLLDVVCAREDDSNFADQQTTDLLPPDIEEAIFEDLPHDILDGISMHDIFTKMTFDDFAECKMDKLDMDVEVPASCPKKVGKEEKNSEPYKMKHLQIPLRRCNGDVDGSQWKSNILQLDGAVDLDSSDNESVSSCMQSDGNNVVRDDQPVKCDRCHRTYRSSIGYERHLPSCDSDFNSDSDSSGDEDVQCAMKQDLGASVEFVQAVEIMENLQSGSSDSEDSESSVDLQTEGVEMVVDVYQDCNENGITVEDVENIQCATVQAVTSSPAILVQQMPQEIIPQYVTSYSQPIQQPELQYFNTPAHNTFHYPTQTVIPAVQPTVVGTIMQSGCDQIVINQPNPLEIYPQPSNVYIANTPMLVGMETVVSNTVMSSSQFIPGVPGVMASSYSATTTQVIQTKPQIDVPQNYVVVNAQPVVNATNLPLMPNTIQTNSPWNNYQMNVQESYKVENVNTSYQTVTRKVIHEHKDVDGVKLINSTQETIVIEPIAHNTIQQHYSCITPVSDIREPIFEKPSDLKPPPAKVVELPRLPTFKKEKPQQAVAPVVIKKLPPPMLEKKDVTPNVVFDQKELPKIDSKCSIGDAPKCNSDIPPLHNVVSEGKKTDYVETPKCNGVPKDVPDKPASVDVESVKSARDETCDDVPTEVKVDKERVRNSVSADSPKILFEIKTEDGFSISTSDPEFAWQNVFDKVQEARKAKGLPPLSKNPFNDPGSVLKKALGLGNHGMKFILEQLPGVSSCSKYQPIYHKRTPTTLELELSKKKRDNQTGCARSEGSQLTKKSYDMFSWLASRHRRPPKLLKCEQDVINGTCRRATSVNLLAMRFRHLKETSKQTVGAFRSAIHGIGLFALREIEPGEMLIEYAGEVIRSCLTDKREKLYTAKGIGCYMFRIDDNTVVDATMKGNAARFINHSCEPNCYSRVVDIRSKKHILIFALRNIVQGEELTYDYKFPLEEDKINCHCLSRKCRKYLN